MAARKTAEIVTAEIVTADAGLLDPGIRGRRMRRLSGLAWASLSVLIFSGWFVVTRFSVTRDLSAWDVAMLRFGIGAVLLSPVLLAGRNRLPGRAWREGLLFMLLWGAPFVLLIAFGLQRTSAARAAAIAPTLMPVWAGILGAVLLRQRQGMIRWGGYAAILAGLCWLIVAGPNGAALDPAGLTALVAAAALWAIYTLLFRRSTLTPLQSAALICFWSAALLLPIYLLFGLSRLSLAAPGEIAIQVVYQGVLMGGVSIVAFNRAIAALGPAAASAVIALVPAMASVLAYPVLGETPTWSDALATAVIVAGVLLASRSSSTAQRGAA
ncbi:DMT family transporter [Bosea sp. (in: a-proteobacteria)]|uniref:DMT family transporter n=1 Tax=Bosea sp. (in: a-proteobacteria) TaxID=1871050 RepID=UPI00122B98BC|nr:DMT family transporter [Bosea sp. (in: a-proteobacteria)]TAJ27957.1 MAG: DMT family transporter [Bosea sp. (in: a-proteobacteria)]